MKPKLLKLIALAGLGLLCWFVGRAQREVVSDAGYQDDNKIQCRRCQRMVLWPEDMKAVEFEPHHHIVIMCKSCYINTPTSERVFTFISFMRNLETGWSEQEKVKVLRALLAGE